MDAADATNPLLSPSETAAMLAASIVLQWWQTTTFIEVAGPGSLALLDGLCTQAVARIEPGTAALGLFLDAKAKVIAPAIVHRHADHSWTDPRRGAQHDGSPRVLLETTPQLVAPLMAHLGRYRLRAQATIEARELGTVALAGAQALGAPTASLDGPDGEWTARPQGLLPTRAFIGPTSSCRELVTLATDAGIGHADPDAFEAARIDRREAGLHDLLPGRMPAEIGGMEHAVALDAGCYLGQEPVARLHYRGRPNRSLRRVEIDGSLDVDGSDGALELRAAAEPDGRARGTLTTWATRPGGSTVALAILRRELQAGDLLLCAGASSTEIRVLDAD